MEKTKEVRGSRASEAQRKMMVEYLKTKPDLLSGKFTNTFTFKDAVKEWSNLAEILNSIPGGAKKDYKSWRKCWQDLRSRTKQKQSSKKSYAAGTGGGPPMDTKLTDLEGDILDIIKKVSVEGHDVSESTFLNIESSTTIEESFDPGSNGREGTNVESPIVVEVVEPVLATNVTSCDTANSNTPIQRQNLRKRLLNKREHLWNSANAAAAYQAHLKEKNKIMQRYYDKKLEILERRAAAQEKLVAVFTKTSETVMELI